MYAIYTLALTLIYTDAAISTGKSMFCLPFKTNVKKVFFKMAAVKIVFPRSCHFNSNNLDYARGFVPMNFMGNGFTPVYRYVGQNMA